MESYVAHVKKIGEPDTWDTPHELSQHLIDTATLAKQFGQDIGDDWAEKAGLWHDLGKYRNRFQEYIRWRSGYEKENAHIENGKRAPHSTAGAIHAIKTLPLGVGHILAYLIAGHHAGLPDWEGGKGALKFRLENGIAEYKESLAENIPANILKIDRLCPPGFVRSPEDLALWMRLLFSCLVDADFLDTESYMQPHKKIDRKQKISLVDLQYKFNEEMQSLRAEANSSSLNDIRNKVLDDCLAAAAWSPGIFSLTVPTGGGKTLSSLGFALKHALLHQKKRIIYAIPFTSIIEQNAKVFRDFLGPDAVLEHHSNLDVKPENETSQSRLAAENWDAPLIVTTNVQLFESLHASRTSRCRKLHNLVNSVIILDEAQQIPRNFHAPITQVMQQLADSYGVTWVLCTATQPVLTESKNTFGQLLLKGLKNVREIMPDPQMLFNKLRRVEIKMPEISAPATNWSDLAEQISAENCVLVIVNTKKHARNLYESLPDDGNKLHLSTHMCAEHRNEVLDEIRARLRARNHGDERPLRVVSTQLIEAGVDVDFPVVYRAMAGLDSIAQSAGRCNREDKLGRLGKVIVFKPETPSPKGFLRQGEDITWELLLMGELAEPLAPQNFQRYFSLMNSKGSRDEHDIVNMLTAVQSPDIPLGIQFRTAAKKFRLIDDIGTAIIVPFRPDNVEESPVEAWLNLLESDAAQTWVYRKLQRYTVTIWEADFNKFLKLGCLELRAGQYLLNDAFYHLSWGVNVQDEVISSDKMVF